MPLGQFGTPPSADISTKDLADLVARLIKEVTYLLNGGLDTLNVNELSADVINAGTLNALLVQIKSALSGATITIDGNGFKTTYTNGMTISIDQNGFKAVYNTGVTITIDQNGFKINNGTNDVFTVSTAGVANFAGNITAGANINIVSNATIGGKLFLDGSNFLNGVYWNGTSIQLYIDPAAGTLRFSAPGGIYANGKRIDI
jgi:hypothetical protein